jgi:putative oxidoreductase
MNRPIALVRPAGLGLDASLLMMRLTSASIFLVHSGPKLRDAHAFAAGLAELGFPIPIVMALLATLAEAVGGAFLVLGLFTRTAAAGHAFVMAVAIVTVHTPWKYGLTGDRGAEFPLLLLLVSIVLVICGGGRLSLDQGAAGVAKRHRPARAELGLTLQRGPVLRARVVPRLATRGVLARQKTKGEQAMKPRIPFAVSIVVVVLGISPASRAGTPQAADGVNLGIGSGDSHRPNILVAWRNTERILEVEVLVRNLGNQAGRGKLVLELCDQEGKTLYATEPVTVSVPAKQNGGDDGTIVQSKGFRMMNLMFDQLDRLHQRYKLRARVQTEGRDLDATDNLAAKSFNADGRALPDSMQFYRYQFVNPSDRPLEATLHLEHGAIPAGWIVEPTPKPGTKITLKPHEVFTGNIVVRTPKTIQNGQYVDFQTSLLSSNKEVIDKDEWYLVGTNEPPEASEPTITARPDGSLAVNVTAYDPNCGIKEASGVQVAYSLDDGVTFSTRVMAYERGNFYTKTWFEGVLGPFAPGVKVKAIVTVENNAGLVRRFLLQPVTVLTAAASLPKTGG